MPPANVLVAQTGHLGDVVLGTPVYRALRGCWPGAKISALVRAENAPVLDGQRFVDAVYADDRRGPGSGWRGLLRTAHKLRACRFDLALGVHLSMRTALLLRLAGIPRRVGFRQSEGWFLYSRVVARDPSLHDTDRQSSLLRALDLPWQRGERPWLEAGAAATRRVRELLRLRGLRPMQAYVAVAPTSAWRSKQWMPEAYALVARRLREAGDPVVLLGAAAERETGEMVAQLAGCGINLIGQTDTGMLAAAIAGADALVSNDAAPQHIAQSLGVPVVTIFGPTSPELGFAPRHAPAAIVEDDPGCRRQCRFGGLPCPFGTYECMKRIDAGRILAALGEVRRRSVGRRRAG